MTDLDEQRARLLKALRQRYVHLYLLEKYAGRGIGGLIDRDPNFRFPRWAMVRVGDHR